MEQLGIYQQSVKGPLANEYRPKNLEDFIGQNKAINIIKKMMDKNEMVNLLIFGPPGTGKTSISKIIAKKLDYNFEYLNAINATSNNVREVSKIAKENLRLNGKKTILLFDEIHRFNKAQQDSLLQDLEDGSLILIATTTENPYYNLNKAIISRCLVIEFEKLKRENVEELVKIVALKENIFLDDEILEYILSSSDGDARTALNILEMVSKVGIEEVKNGLRISSKYGDDDKYNRISAMIKSIRGSDADAAVYWLASMIDGGEDIMYIARRLVISASEDIGLANPSALNMAVSAMQAIEKIGLPEARIILSECVIYLAISPKSNSAYNAINLALEEIKKNGHQKVPFHLSPVGRSKYLYPHNYENNYVEQDYMEKKLKLYNEGSNKTEQAFKEFWRKVKNKWNRK